MNRLLLITLLLPVHFCVAQNITLLKDINPGNNSSYPDCYGSASNGTQACFWADNETNGNELWITDGTPSGTHMVCDILTDGSQQNYSGPVYFNGNWYFSADDGVNGTELWSTNGTTCTFVKDIRVGSGSSHIEGLVVFNNAIYFKALDGTNFNLWKSDGTTEGTVQLDNTYAFQGSELVEYNGKLYFYGKTASNSSGLLATDGSSISMVKAISSTGNAAVADLTSTSIGLFFIAYDAVNGREVWISDGTDPGTHMVKDINPSGNGRQNDGVMTFYNGELYFDANDGTNGNEVWKSDGTSAGTVMLKDINTSGSSLYLGDFRGVVFNGHLYFIASADFSDFEVWKTDGSSGNTQILKDINATANANPYSLYVFNNQLLFTADDGSHGQELWISDGTTAGTTLLEDLNAGTNGSIDNLYFITLNNTLLFPADNGTTGFELYQYSSTVTSTSSSQSISLQLYPNPATTSLTVNSTGETLRIVVYNVQGVLVKEYTAVQDNDIINVSSLDKGLYVFQVYDQNGKSEQVKIIKE